jgi:hypothetical protein
MRHRTVTVIAALASAALLGYGCSSTTSPSSVVDWFLDAAWESAADFPPGADLGASLVWDGDRSVYALCGNVSRNDRGFWRYDTVDDTWTELTSASFDPAWASSMAWDGDDCIYALQGNGTDQFYRYTIPTDTWDRMASFPEWGVRQAAHTLVRPGTGNYLYAAKGNYETVFARYDMSGDTWDYLEPIPQRMSMGTSIAWGGGYRIFAAADSLEFYEYSIPADQWFPRAPYPEPLYWGSWLCYDGEGSLFMTRGDTTAAFWRYDIADDTWEALDDAPGGFARGGTIVSDGEAVYALPGMFQTDFWAFRP